MSSQAEIQTHDTTLSLPARMEAILYLKGRALTLGELAEIAAVSRDQAEIGLITLMADYAHRDTAWRSARRDSATACSCATGWVNWCRTCCRWISPPQPCAPWPPLP